MNIIIKTAWIGLAFLTCIVGYVTMYKIGLGLVIDPKLFYIVGVSLVVMFSHGVYLSLHILKPSFWYGACTLVLYSILYITLLYSITELLGVYHVG